MFQPHKIDAMQTFVGFTLDPA